MTEVLDPKTKELVGIAASVAGHCQPCSDYHAAEAKEFAVTLDEIRAAVKLAEVVRQAGNSNVDKFVRARLEGENANR